jgi:hypothetical protein
MTAVVNTDNSPIDGEAPNDCYERPPRDERSLLAGVGLPVPRTVLSEGERTATRRWS